MLDSNESLQVKFPERYARVQKFKRRAALWSSLKVKFVKEVDRRIETRLVQGETK